MVVPWGVGWRGLRMGCSCVRDMGAIGWMWRSYLHQGGGLMTKVLAVWYEDDECVDLS